MKRQFLLESLKLKKRKLKEKLLSIEHFIFKYNLKELYIYIL